MMFDFRKLAEALKANRFTYAVLKPLVLGARLTVATVQRIARSMVRGFCNKLSILIVEHLAVPLGRLMSTYRLRRGEGRTLWGITPILTLPVKAMADRCLGLKSDAVVFHTYSIARSFDINLSGLLQIVLKRAPSLYTPLHRLVLAWVLVRYDIVHFFADRGIMPSAGRVGIDQWEMDQLKKSSKRLYVYCYGADVRTRERTLALGKWNFCIHCPSPGKLCICDDTAGRKNIAAIERRANAIVSLGDMLAYIPNPVHLDYWPIDVESIGVVGSRCDGGALKVAHAPNHPYFKGSQYLVEVIESLRAQGHAIELTTISGVSNTRVLEIFSECDVVADQFIGGAYGYTALEGMARGKPVMSYVRSASLVETAEECPLLIATPDNLRDVLLWILSNKDKLPAIGKQGRAYIERWHSVSAVAERLGRLYESTGDLPLASLRKIRYQRDLWLSLRANIPMVEGWRHPWQISAS